MHHEPALVKRKARVELSQHGAANCSICREEAQKGLVNEHLMRISTFSRLSLQDTISAIKTRKVKRQGT